MLMHIPLWVFAVLALVLALGVSQTRSREVTPGRSATIAAAMVAYSLWGACSAFGLAWMPLAAWVAGMALALVPVQGWASAGGLVAVPERGTVLVSGSWRSMVLILGIFSVKFLLGFATGMGVPVSGASLAAALAALALGWCSGGFAARARDVLRVQRRAGSMAGAARQ